MKKLIPNLNPQHIVFSERHLSLHQGPMHHHIIEQPLGFSSLNVAPV